MKVLICCRIEGVCNLVGTFVVVLNELAEILVGIKNFSWIY